jgi:trans-aconitate methyltransferase
MTGTTGTVTLEWLSLREPADHAARSRDLVQEVTSQGSKRGLVVHDLGCGTGSMTRWLAPQLPGPQLWMLHDQDDELLARAVSGASPDASDGTPVRMVARAGDVTGLRADDFAGAHLVTASALLDLLTAREVEAIAQACVDGSCEVLFTLTVTGEVSLSPRHQLDEAIRSAFNAHQRRTHRGRRLLGPDAVAHTAGAFTRLGANVVIRPSSWRLGPADVGLVVEWLTGWVGAACEQRPELADLARAYLRDRLADAAAGRLRVAVAHADLFAAAPHAAVEPRGRGGRVAARRESHRG